MPSARRSSSARSPCTSSSSTSPSSTTGCGGVASTRSSGAFLTSRSPRRCPASSARASSGAAIEDAATRISLELVLTAHPTEATRRSVLAAHLRLSRLLALLDDSSVDAGEAAPGGGGARRGGDAPLADGRGALAPPARRGRDPARALVLRAELPARRRARARRLPAAPAGRAGAVPVRDVDRRRPRRQPECRGPRPSRRR